MTNQKTTHIIYDYKEVKCKQTMNNLRGIRVVKDYSIIVKDEDGYETLKVHIGCNKKKTDRKKKSMDNRYQRMESN